MQKKLRILIVDDNKAIHTLFASMFKDTEFRIIYAKNGEEALEILRWDDFDIIFLDLIMPKIYGLDMIKKIKDIKHNKPYKIIMMTGAEADELITEALRLGAVGYLQKPFELKEISEVFSKAFTRA